MVVLTLCTPMKIFSDSELQESSVTRNFRITASDDKSYDTQHYNLAAIIAVSHKVNSEQAVHFHKCATATDYDVNAQATKRFFATVQNKLHWATGS